MSIQNLFSRFHKEIKVETDELREKRDILMDKIRASLKREGHPIPDLLNQGSYIYGVGVKPVGDVEYDIDVGLDFSIVSTEHYATSVRKWVYDAISDHTNKVEDRGPCIRVRYAAGYHVDLVVYAKYKNSQSYENYQLARNDNTWSNVDPKKLKEFISIARKPFSESKDSSGSDQLQRVTRYLKRWNDVDTPDDSPDKPFGLAMLLLVIKHLSAPIFDGNNEPDDLEALIKVANSVISNSGRIEVRKPTPEFEDVFGKLNQAAMDKLKKRFSSLLAALVNAKNKNDEDAARILKIEFGEQFPENLKKSEDDGDSSEQNKRLIADMNSAIPTFEKPSKPWCRE